MVAIKRISFLQFTRILLTGILVFTQQSCIDDELTTPVRLSLSAIITEQNKTNDNLSFRSGEIIINEIQEEIIHSILNQVRKSVLKFFILNQ